MAGVQIWGSQSLGHREMARRISPVGHGIDPSAVGSAKINVNGVIQR